MKSLTGILMTASWLITALASLHIGLCALGFHGARMYVMEQMPQLVLPLQYIVGIAGLISLVSFFMYLSRGCGCNCKSGSGYGN